MTRKARYLWSLLGAALIFTAINVVVLLRIPSCCDYMYGYGFPSPFFVTGGFAGIREFRWYGLVIDVIALMFFAQFLSWAWKRFSARKLLKPAQE